jgi:hypothetical protein
MALVQRKESDRENMNCQGFSVKSMLKNAKVKMASSKSKA